MPHTSINSLITQKMIDDHIQPDTSTPPFHTLLGKVRKSLNQLLEHLKHNCTGWNKSWHNSSHKHVNWHGQFSTCLTEAITHHYEALPMGKKWNKEAPWCTSNLQHPFQLVSTYHCSVQERWWKCLVINYRALSRVTWELMWPMLRAEDIFSKLNGTKYFSTLDLHSGYHNIPSMKTLFPKQLLLFASFRKYKYLKVPFGLAQALAYFQKLKNKVLKDLQLATAYLDDIIIYSKIS